MEQLLGESTVEHDLSAVAELLAAHNLPSPSEVFLQNLTSEVNHQDVCKMTTGQLHMLQRFEKTNEMLLNFNMLSNARYDTTCREFTRHTQLLQDMKRDLDSVFKRIRVLKSKLNKQHPEAFKVAYGSCSVLNEEEEEEEAESEAGPISVPPSEAAVQGASAKEDSQDGVSREKPASEGKTDDGQMDNEWVSEKQEAVAATKTTTSEDKSSSKVAP